MRKVEVTEMGRTGDGKSAVATPDGKSRKKKILIIQPYRSHYSFAGIRLTVKHMIILCNKFPHGAFHALTPGMSTIIIIIIIINRH